MNYEGQICRAPMERSSFMLPVTVGCPYNQCKFCNLFRHLRYRELPAEKIEEELKRVKDIGGSPTKIFLGDGMHLDLRRNDCFGFWNGFSRISRIVGQSIWMRRSQVFCRNQNKN